MDSIALFMQQQADSSLRRERYIRRLNSSSVLDLSNKSFIKNFRLTKRAFLYVLKEIESDLGIASRSTSLPPATKLATCLKFLAEGSYQQAVGKDFHLNIAQPTVSKVLQEVLNILERKLCGKWITIRMSEEEKLAARHYFYTKSGIPGITLCVDGTHVKILKPGQNNDAYYNRKLFYSLNVLIVCDHERRIRYVNAKYPGSCHDSHIWNLSSLKVYIENQYRNSDRSIRLLGDSGYPLQPWLLTPYRGAEEGTRESRFNTKHSSARNIVERTIGNLKNRFRCLMDERALYYNDKKSAQIINVCTALHNICLHFDRDFRNGQDEIYLNEANAESDTVSRELDMKEGRNLRNEILSYF